MNTINKIIVCLILVVLSCNKKIEKEIWLEEPNEIKYSENREKEVWGKILRGDDAEIFYGTPLYSAALAIVKKNDDKIEEEINKINLNDINYQEPKFNTTIGHLALINDDISALKLLVSKGLDCNIMDKEGHSVVTSINDSFKSRLDNSLEVLKYIIKKGGNVNLLNTKKGSHDRTPLIVASKSNLENVKLLIDSGADPNFVYKENPSDQFPQSSLISALGAQRMDIIAYLIYEAKVDFKSLKYSPKSKYSPNGYKILGYLRFMTFELNSEKHKEKMKLVNYLLEEGLDYWNTEIPKNIRNNDRFTEEYLNKY